MGIGVEVTVVEEGGVYIISLDGRLDASSTPVVEKKIAGVLEKASRVVIDFSNVNYLSSAGMRLLLSATKKLHAKEGKIAFFGMEEDVLQIIKIAGFERILNIFDTKQKALQAVE